MTGVAGWRRSSHCASGECIEVMASDTFPIVYLRRVQDGVASRPYFITGRAEWDAFLAGVKAGEFDDV